jgi:Protein of unknown function (DUF3465)
MRAVLAGASAALQLAAATMCGCALNGGAADNAAALAAIAHARSGAEVTVEGLVVRVLDTSGGPQGAHARFIVAVRDEGAEQDVMVADNISIGRAAPVHRGDDVTVRGELALDASGPVIHWTHHDPRGRHESGFVRLNGIVYE